MQWRLRIRPSRNSRELAHSSAHGWGPAVLTAGPVQIPNAQGGWQPAGQQFHVPVTDRAMPQVNAKHTREYWREVGLWKKMSK